MMTRRLFSFGGLSACWPALMRPPDRDHFGCRIGPISQWLSPGLGFCGHCETTWNWVWGHSTNFMTCEGDPPPPRGPKATDGKVTAGSGMFPLCELCWREMTPAERLPYYRVLYDRWMADYGSPVDWSVVERSVLNEPPQGYDPFKMRSYVGKDGTTYHTNSPTRVAPEDPGPGGTCP